MKCGDRGFLTAEGKPCGQNIGATARACLWHLRSPSERSLLASTGSIVSRMNKALPPGYEVPEFNDEAAVIAFSRAMAQTALTKERVDLKRLSEARGWAGIALQAFGVAVQRRLTDALAKIEHGELAVGILAQIRAGDAPRRPLPWKLPRVPMAEAEQQAEEQAEP